MESAELTFIVWYVFIGVFILTLAWIGFKWLAHLSSGKVKVGRGRLMQAGWSGQMEFDMRLTYKRFKQLYPLSNISYPEYKKMQMERAFRRSVSSQKNKRMVR